MAQKPHRKSSRRFWRYIKLRVIHANDSPHRIALGVGLGLFVAWSPAFGLHILLALMLALLLRANKIAAMTSVWVSNPFTIFFIYYPSYRFGRWIFRLFGSQRVGSDEQFRELLGYFNSSAIISPIFTVDFWKDLFALLWSESPELWVGSAIIGFFVGALGYFVMYQIIVYHRRSNPRRRHLKYK